MFAVNCHAPLDYRSSGDSAYFAPRSNSSARKASGWGMAVKPLPLELPSRPALLQFADAVAQVLAKQVNTNLLDDLHSKDREIQGLIAKVNRLESNVQQLLQQHESSAAQTTQLVTSTIESDLTKIASIYGALDAEQTAFLHARPHLVPILLTARPLITAVFGDSTPISLDLIEADQPSAHLYLLIHTKASYLDSAALDKDFESRWIAAVPHTIHSELTPTLQFE